MGKKRETKVNLANISRVFLNKSLKQTLYNLCRILVLPDTVTAIECVNYFSSEDGATFF